MRALALRDLSVIAGQPAFLLAMCLHAGVLAAFLAAWSNGVPQLPGNVYEQQRLVQWLTLAILLPWTAVRCLPREQRRDVVLLALLTAVRPSRVLLARTLAAFLALSLLLASGLPMVLLAQQVAGIPLPQVLRGFGCMLGLVAVSSAISVWWIAACSDHLTAWLGSMVTLVGMLVGGAFLVPPAVAPWLLWTASVVAGWRMMRAADVSMRYLPEDPA